jgi:hypothetical protein
VTLVPEREGDQPPELAREILPAGDVSVEKPRDDDRIEEALPPETLRREKLAR